MRLHATARPIALLIGLSVLACGTAARAQTLLMAAGGGGGGGYQYDPADSAQPGGNAQTGTSGAAGSGFSPGAGGSNGSAGAPGAYTFSGGGGAGYLGNGGPNPNGGKGGDGPPTFSGGAGYDGGAGGFGGGAGGSTTGGGGGGYSGGGGGGVVAGHTQDSAGGGGGGSFVNSLLTSTNITQASTAGNGSAEIVPPTGSPTTFNPLGQVQTYTTPASGSYVLLALGASGGTGYSQSYSSNAGGLATQAIGVVTLPAGFTLDIAVGTEGASGISYGGGGGGGGGTFIYEAPEPAAVWLLLPALPYATRRGRGRGGGRAR